MKNKKIAIIGGAGFIGHNLSLHLKKAGHDVFVIDSLSVNNMLSFADMPSKNRNLYWSILNNRIELLHNSETDINVTDARDYNALSILLSQFKPEIIVHLAAVSHADQSNKDPHNTFDHSLRTLENVLDISRSFKSKVIYFSSSMVYGNFLTEQVDEDAICNPIGIYGTLKYCGELLVKSYNQVFELPYTIIRPSALYGQRCVSRRVGQIFIENAIRGDAITINGKGDEKLDFTYIQDLIQGVKLCIDNKSSDNEIFNITFGNSREIHDLAKIIKENFENIEIEYKEKKKFVPSRGTLSIDKAKKLLGYKPRYSIEKGYLEYINWYKGFWNNLNK